MMDKNNREYTNGEITVYWKPSECIHSTICYKNLIEVFNPSKRPWINMAGAPNEKIIDIVKRCPTKALTYTYNNGKTSEKPPETEKKPVAKECGDVRIEIIQNGPLLIEGKFTITGTNNLPARKDRAYFCRCGKSNNMPYCDGTHRKINFIG